MKRYQLIMLCKSNNINHPNQYWLNIQQVTGDEATMILDSLALQGHDLKNVALYSPESTNFRQYKPIDEYGYIKSEEDYKKRQYLKSLPLTMS